MHYPYLVYWWDCAVETESAVTGKSKKYMYYLYYFIPEMFSW